MFKEINKYPAPLRRSVLEGMFTAIMSGGALVFIVPFAVYLGANSLQVGLISAVPALLAAWFQLGSLKLLEFYQKRSTVVIFSGIVQAISWLLIAILPFVAPTSQLSWFIALTIIGTVISSIAHPWWQSWMRSLTPKEILGEYFGFRNAIIGFVVFATTIICGFMLQVAEPSFTLYAFIGIFALGFIGKMVSAYLSSGIYEPKMESDPAERVSFWFFIEQMKKNNFGNFMLYGTLMTFAIAIITPFISLYFLKDLGLENDYFFYTILISAATLTSIVSMPYWGKIIDKHGTIRLLAATGFLACFYPVFLIFIRDPVLLIALQLFDGVAFSGFLLALYNFIYDSFEPKKLIYYSAFQLILFGTATFFGTLVGGYLLMFPLPTLLGALSLGYAPASAALSSVFTIPFFVICALSFVIRIVVYFALIWQIKDVRDTKYISQRQLVISVLTFQPIRESLYQNFSLMLAGGVKTVAVVEDELERAEKFAFNKIRTAKKVTKKTVTNVEKVIQKKRKDRGFI